MSTRLKMTIFFLFLITFWVPVQTVNAQNVQEKDITGESVLIKVGLVNSSSTITTRVDSGQYRLVDGTIGLPITSLNQGDTIQFNIVGMSIQLVINGVVREGTYKGSVLLEAIDKTGLNLFSFRNIKFRDDLRIVNDNGLAAVNVLDIEKYLYGVVGLEMGLYAPLEALKVQAVVSRSYALNLFSPLNKWDVGIDTATQVYGGYSVEIIPGGMKAVQAVNETRNLVIYYQFDEVRENRPIAAYFHANAGGYTENSENVWVTPLPYLVATPSPYDQYALHYPNQDTTGWPAWCFSWTEDFSRSQVLDLINQYNTDNREKENAMILVGRLEDLQVSYLQRDLPVNTLSGRATQLDFIGSEGTAGISRERTRTFFGLQSSMYTIKLDSELTMLNSNGAVAIVSRGLDLIGIGSNESLQKLNGAQDRYYVAAANGNVTDIPKIFEQVTISGQGHGHGLGMSQWGAIGMVNAGYNYEDIIRHYYNQGKNDGNLVIREYASQ